MTDLDDFIAGYQPRTVTVAICQRADLLDRHAALEAEAVKGAGSLAGHPKASELADLEDQIEQASVPFVFKALSRKGWADLLAKHQPSKDNVKEGLDFNPETFPQAAIAACSLDPVITVEQSDRLVDLLPQGEWQRLWGAVLTCNVEVVNPPKSVLAAVARATNGSSATTAAPEGSLGASS